MRQVWVANAQPTQTPTPEISPTLTATPTPLPPTPTVVIQLSVIATPTPRPTPTPTLPGSPPLATASPVVAQSIAWSTPINISKTPGRSEIPYIAADRFGRVHVVWREQTGEGDESSVYYSAWDGSSWSAPQAVLFLSEQTWIGAIALAADGGGTLHAVWTDVYNLYYSQALGDEAGQPSGWSEPLQIGHRGRAASPAMIVDSEQTIHVVWVDNYLGPNPTADIRYTWSRNGSQVWPLPNRISDNRIAEAPVIGIDGLGTLHVLWAGENPGENGTWDIYHVYSEDGGQSWSWPLDVAGGLGIFGRPRLVVDDEGFLHLLRIGSREQRRSDDLYHQRWDGKSWSEPTPVLATAGQTIAADVACDSDGTLHIVMVVRLRGHHEILYTRSTDSGRSWLPLQKAAAIARASEDTVDVRIAVSLGHELHAVWSDSTSGNAEVYCATAQSPAPAWTPLPRPPTPTPSPTAVSTATPTTAVPLVTAPTVTPSRPAVATPGEPIPANQTMLDPLLVAVVPVLGLIAVVLITRPLWTGQTSWRRFWREAMRKARGGLE